MIEYSTFTLDNGLRIVHHHDPHTPMLALNVLYNVGARDESPSLTGMAHLMEHLMFGGSVNIPHFDKAIEAAGGWDNAWTSNDFTNFYDVVPAVNAETAFWLESDRMFSLAFSERSLEVQRSVVIEEFKQTCLNQPYGDMAHHLRSLLYTVHPYRYPTIGREISHIERVKLDDIKKFFYTHYAPNNAVVAVVGNITIEHTRELAEKWFGPIPRRDIAPRCYPAEPVHDTAAEKTVRANVPQPMISVAFPMPGYNGDGYVECDLITDLLASGRSSRYHQRLVMGNPLFVNADASILGSEEPGALILTAVLADNSDRAVDEARTILVDEAMKLATEPVTPRELARAVNRFESNRIFSSTSYLPKARQLAMAEMHREDINTVVDRYRQVTPDDISRVATSILDHSRAATLLYRPA